MDLKRHQANRKTNRGLERNQGVGWSRQRRKDNQNAWDSLVPQDDQFQFKYKGSYQEPSSKRVFFSEIAKVYGPLSWIAPLTIRLKILMQQTWTRGLDWDDYLPEDMQLKWRELDSELSELPQIFIDRPIGAVVTSDIQLHVFVDASESAYATALYARVTNSEGKISWKLITAKTRLAPIKQTTVPCLELCAAHLGANLMETSLKAISKSRFTINQIFSWTDSMIVLAWLSDLPRRWNCFVDNFVAKIQEIPPPDKCKHASSQDNPTNCASRGTSLQQLKNEDLWWRGPNCLACPPTEWPKVPVVRVKTCLKKRGASLDTNKQINQSLKWTISQVSTDLSGPWQLSFVQ